MALDAYMCEFFPEVDLGAVSYWDIGKLNPHSIFHGAIQFIPDIYERIIQEEMQHLPQIHLTFWKTDEETFWQCQYCSFWCDLFDQSIMECHLLNQCKHVCHKTIHMNLILRSFPPFLYVFFGCHKVHPLQSIKTLKANVQQRKRKRIDTGQ